VPSLEEATIMTVFSNRRIDELYEASLKAATHGLQQIPVYCGNEPSFPGLKGWVYEQTIQYCIKKELDAKKVKAEVSEQVKLKPRMKVDLRIGDVAIEIKMSGLFSTASITKYGEYRKTANAMGVTYLFLTGGERYQQYRDGIVKALDRKNVFFLDRPGQWRRFIKRLLRLLKKGPA
jgi:hypothetical protein